MPTQAILYNEYSSFLIPSVIHFDLVTPCGVRELSHLWNLNLNLKVFIRQTQIQT